MMLLAAASGDFWKPFWLSLRIASTATIIDGALIIPLAWFMARATFIGKSVFEALILLPLVLPPTVLGYMILMLFGVQGPLGGWTDRHFGYSIIFRFEGAVLVGAIVAAPLIYIPSKAAFGSIDRDLEDAARLFGATTAGLFWHVSLPLARRGLLAAVVLGFARALGEFGATVMVLGWQPSHLTLPISIYSAWTDGNLARANVAVIALSLISMVLIVAYNLSSSGRQEGS